MKGKERWGCNGRDRVSVSGDFVCISIECEVMEGVTGLRCLEGEVWGVCV